MIDLHMHTTASDGTDSPAQVIEKCRKLGLELCSITDHDTIDSQGPAMAAAAEAKLDYLTGVEFSVVYEGELHILGYGIDTENRELRESIEGLRESRVSRMHKILGKLRDHRVDVEENDVRKFSKGKTMGRPHIAQALVEKGYAADIQDAFVKYLNERGLCYVQRRKLGVEKAVGLIRNSGGTPVIAHPKFIRAQNFEEVAKKLKDMGMEGIEAYYPAHTDAEVEQFVRVAEQNGMIVTEGSDYHGSMRPNIALACEKRSGPLLERSIAYLKEKYVR